METQDYSVGLDIGTTKIVAIVGRKNSHGKIEVWALGKVKVWECTKALSIIFLRP